jgi:hypothetical protein
VIFRQKYSSTKGNWPHCPLTLGRTITALIITHVHTWLTL